MALAGLTEGRIVHYVLPESETCKNPGAHRAAMVVLVCPAEWGYPEGHANLEVHTDYGNDYYDPAIAGRGTFWATSVPFDNEEKAQGTWHWVEPA